MAKRVKMSQDFYFRNKDNKKKMRLNKLKKISSFFTKVPKFFAYHYKYNRANLITISTFSLLFLVVVIPAVISTFGKLGFNQNVTLGENILVDAWFNKLVEKKTITRNYTEYDDSIEWFDNGDGSQGNPFKISNGKQLKIMDQLLNTGEYGSYIYDGNTIRLRNETDYSFVPTYSSENMGEFYSTRSNRWLYYRKEHIHLTNNTDARVSHLWVEFHSSETDWGTRDVIRDSNNNFGVWINNHELSEGNGFSYDTNRRIMKVDTAIDYLEPGESIDLSFLVTSYNQRSSTYQFDQYRIVTDPYDVHFFPVEDNPVTNTNGLEKFYFELTENISFPTGFAYDPIGTEWVSFNGHFNGNFHVIKNLNLNDNGFTGRPFVGLFARLGGNAEVKNINFDNLIINADNYNGGNESYYGAVAGYANGDVKIYNIGVMSGTIRISSNLGKTGYLGSIIGRIINRVKVVNCFNNASITIGPNNNAFTVGGLVGRREGTDNLIDNTSRLFLLVNYGAFNYGTGSCSVNGGTNCGFVYTGDRIDQTKSPGYLYYLWNGDVTDARRTENYANFKTSEEMNADGFKAHLNNYRYLANFYLGYDTQPRGVNNASQKTGYPEIASWYTNNYENLYPWIKQYEKDPDDSYKYYSSSTEASSACKNGYIILHITNESNSNQNVDKFVCIVDKDEANNDYTNRKIILPNNDRDIHFEYKKASEESYISYGKVLTGWTIGAIRQNNKYISSKINPSIINYNLVLREGTNAASKDIGTIYAQGGFYLVPDGVTEVTIRANWAWAIYIRDKYTDVVYNTNYSRSGNSSNFKSSYNSWSEDGVSCATAYTDSDGGAIALSKAINSAGTINGQRVTPDKAVLVLCGNLHVDQQRNEKGKGNYDNYLTYGEGSGDKKAYWPWGYDKEGDGTFSYMSLDEDGDNEPDYSIYYHNVHDSYWPNIRFDFVNLLSLPQVGRVNSRLNNITMNNATTVEFTETVKTDLIDIRHGNSSSFKLNGGYFNIYNAWGADDSKRQKNYIYFGGRARAKYFNAGNESTSAVSGSEGSTVPVFVVAGGRIDTLSATYLNADVGINDNVFFYVDGGYINKFYSTYNSGIKHSARSVFTGSYINEFYAGGHSDNAVIEEGVVSNIFNSRIGELYGGPQYGKIVGGSVINIFDSTVDTLFGGGYGGSQTIETEQEVNRGACGTKTYSYNITNTCGSSAGNYSYCPGRYLDGYGVETGFMSLLYSVGGCAAKSFSRFYSTLSVAEVDNVVINASGGTIGEIYGGGNKGAVNGSVVMNLDGVEANNVYGGGRTNSEGEKVMITPRLTASNYSNPGFVSFSVDVEGNYPTKEEYTWVSPEDYKGSGYIDEGTKTAKSENVSKLGNVNGEIYINIKDSTIHGSIYGGGNKAAVKSDIYMNLYGDNDFGDGEFVNKIPCEDDSCQEDYDRKYTNNPLGVFGGGNSANVDGNIDLRLNGGKYKNVFAAGNEGLVTQTSTITVQQNVDAENIFGGGNKSTAGKSVIYYEDGKTQNVYGGSNKTGEVDESNILIGVKNEETQKFKPGIYLGGGSPVPKVENVEDTNLRPYLPDINACAKQIDYGYNSGGQYQTSRFDFYIVNNTNVTFDEVHAYIEFYDDMGTDVGYWGENYKIDYNRAAKTLELTNLRPWEGGGAAFTVAPNQRRYLTGDNNGQSTGIFHLGNAYPSIDIKSLRIEAWSWADDKVKYTAECIDKDEQAGNSKVNDFSYLEIDVPEYVTKEPSGKMEITNVFGGNNVGGKTINSNIYITGENAFVEHVFGGGNLAETTNTNVKIENASGVGYIYGGGNGITEYDDKKNVLDPTTTQGTVTGKTNVLIINSVINNNVYAGGNGRSAFTLGDSTITISGADTVINASVFGGGNQSDNGNTEKISNTYVNIAGGTIMEDVYGGPNTSRVRGATFVDVGYVAEGIESADVLINGTVFGGGRANLNDSGKYDYRFESVTDGTNVLIQPRDGHDVTINGSVYGSGNNSTISGDSIVKFVDFGTEDNPKEVVSIQRTTQVLFDNSSIYVPGATDSTNVIASVVYSLSRIDDFILANDSTLYVKNNANLLKKFSSMKIEGETKEYESVSIDPDTGEATTNVNNKIFLEPETAFSILETEAFVNGIFGEVKGMTFFGLYKKINGEIRKGVYSDKYNYGDEVSSGDAYLFTVGSVINGAPVDDVNVNGFFTNTFDETDNNKLKARVIDPDKDNITYYAWILGEQSDTFTVELKASKFSKDGVSQVLLNNEYSAPRTYFEILALSDIDLDPSVKIVSADSIPRVAENDEDALTNFGLTMKQSITGWMTDGRTDFYAGDGNPSFDGTKRYNSNDTSAIPSFDFYLTNSKNITESRDLGSVLIAVRAYVPKDEVSYIPKRIYFRVKLETLNKSGDSYEAMMTPGKEYDLFNDNLTYITSNSALSASFSMYATLKDDKDKTKPKSVYMPGDYRVLSTSYRLPANTHITMIDKTDYSNPVYYYYNVTDADSDAALKFDDKKLDGYTTQFYHYPLDKFVRMGSNSTDNHFSDVEANNNYYDPVTGVSSELFLFIVDFADAEFSSDRYDEEILLEILSGNSKNPNPTVDDLEARVTVEAKGYVQHSIYSDTNTEISVDLTPDRETAYVGSELNITAALDLRQATQDGLNVSIYDTNYIQDKMGLKISIYDEDGNIVDGPSLIGTLFYIDNQAYSANYDGTVRMKVSDLVTKVRADIKVDLSKSRLTTGTYRIVAEAFGSPDGLYYGLTSAGVGETIVKIVNDNYGLDIVSTEEEIIIDSDTSLNLNDVNESKFIIKYTSQYQNPNLRFKLYRRVYDKAYSLDYELVSSSELFSDSFESTGTSEYMIKNSDLLDENEFIVHFNSLIRTGTYKLVVELYDGNNFIGDDFEYIFVKQK